MKHLAQRQKQKQNGPKEITGAPLNNYDLGQMTNKALTKNVNKKFHKDAVNFSSMQFKIINGESIMPSFSSNMNHFLAFHGEKCFQIFLNRFPFHRRMNRGNKGRNCSQVAICIIYDIHVIS